MSHFMLGEFSFNGIMMRQKYGIVVEKIHDTIQPKLRPRKITIPGKSGCYDYGAEQYEERPLIFDCNIAKPMTRAQLREIAYILSQKKEIRTWTEPDKYYIGQLYNPEELERICQDRHRFTLNFVCNPFAYTETITAPLKTGVNRISYQGTAKAPSLIILKNTGSTPIQNVRITARFRK